MHVDDDTGKTSIVQPRFKDAKQHSTQLVCLKDAKINKEGSYATMNYPKPEPLVKQHCTSTMTIWMDDKQR